MNDKQMKKANEIFTGWMAKDRPDLSLGLDFDGNYEIDEVYSLFIGFVAGILVGEDDYWAKG